MVWCVSFTRFRMGCSPKQAVADLDTDQKTVAMERHCMAQRMGRYPQLCPSRLAVWLHCMIYWYHMVSRYHCEVHPIVVSRERCLSEVHSSQSSYGILAICTWMVQTADVEELRTRRRAIKVKGATDFGGLCIYDIYALMLACTHLQKSHRRAPPLQNKVAWRFVLYLMHVWSEKVDSPDISCIELGFDFWHGSIVELRSSKSLSTWSSHVQPQILQDRHWPKRHVVTLGADSPPCRDPRDPWRSHRMDQNWAWNLLSIYDESWECHWSFKDI